MARPPRPLRRHSSPEQPVLVEHVVRRAHVAGVHRRAEVRVEELDAEVREGLVARVEGLRGEGPGVDRDHVAELAVVPQRAQVDLLVLPHDLELEPRALLADGGEHLGGHGDEIGVRGDGVGDAKKSSGRDDFDVE